MIKKLKQRIFWIITIALSTVILGIIILFSILNYRNTINTATLMMDRITNDRKDKENPMENDRNLEDINIEGLYVFIVSNSEIINSSDTSHNETIEQYAIQLSNGRKDNGIIGKYIYKVRKTRENTRVMLMENENAIKQIYIIFISSFVISISLIIIIIIARRISEIIVEPVKNTFEKQKQFISDASHELKTPLAVIEANTDVLENEISNNKWLGYIQNEIDSMNKLINELLLLAKIENIQSIKEYQEIDLSKEIEKIVLMFESMAYENSVHIKADIQENIKINANKEDIEHILSTLIDNAIKHTIKDKEIIVELSKEKNNVKLQVKNMGLPIPEEEREKIFERFYRIDKSRNRNEKRYGLGLSIAKSTVQKYNGKIEVYCKDNFTIFKVLIPFQ